MMRCQAKLETAQQLEAVDTELETKRARVARAQRQRRQRQQRRRADKEFSRGFAASQNLVARHLAAGKRRQFVRAVAEDTQQRVRSCAMQRGCGVVCVCVCVDVVVGRGLVWWTLTHVHHGQRQEFDRIRAARRRYRDMTQQVAMEERRRTVAKVNAEIARGLEERRQKEGEEHALLQATAQHTRHLMQLQRGFRHTATATGMRSVLGQGGAGPLELAIMSAKHNYMVTDGQPLVGGAPSSVTDDAPPDAAEPATPGVQGSRVGAEVDVAAAGGAADPPPQATADAGLSQEARRLPSPTLVPRVGAELGHVMQQEYNLYDGVDPMGTMALANGNYPTPFLGNDGDSMPPSPRSPGIDQRAPSGPWADPAIVDSTTALPASGSSAYLAPPARHRDAWGDSSQGPPPAPEGGRAASPAAAAALQRRRVMHTLAGKRRQEALAAQAAHRARAGSATGLPAQVVLDPAVAGRPRQPRRSKSSHGARRLSITGRSAAQ